MTKWEYKIFRSEDAEGGGLLTGHSKEQLEAYLNTLGAEGWEIVSVAVDDFSPPTFMGVAKRPASE